MAKYEFGINGPFNGKLGTVVGCTWKGIPYMRSLPKKRTGKVSEAAQRNRKKFDLAQQWLKPLTPFLRVGFKGYQERVEGFVAAKSYLLKNAMDPHEDQFIINPEKMVVSFGSLAGPLDAQVILTDANILQFTWSTSAQEKVNPLDQVMMMAYCVEEKEAIYQTIGVFRKIGIDELILPPHFKHKSVLTYLAFVSADRMSQSMSVYLSRISIKP
jgi:hypothetical protein